MTPIPAPSLVLPQEDWADTDFDLPDGDPLNTQSDVESDNDEDWDVEMDLGKTGGAKAVAATSSPLASSLSTPFDMITIHPPIQIPSGEQADDEDDYEDEGASTIKVMHMPPIPPKTPQPPDEDIENAFELPSELSQLSLRPLTLHHRSSKTSLEWGDRDHTSSSTSSDAYSTLGFGPSASPSSNSTSAPSAGELETDEEDDDDDGELDGLVLPTGLFDSGHGGRQLSKILEAKKRLPVVDERFKVANPDSEDDFEIGLVIDDDFDLSPSRLPSNRPQPTQEGRKTISRSKSAPPRPPVGAARPVSRLIGTRDRAKSPTALTSTSAKSLRSLAISPPSTSSRPTATRMSTFQTLSSAPPSSHSSTFLQSPTSGPLRAQKSHSVLKPPSPRGAGSSGGHLSRKASLSSLIDTNIAGPSSSSIQSPTSYNAPTAASRARMQQAQTQFNPHSTTRLRAPDLEHHYAVPPTRPSTPSSSTAALRLTMPTSSSRAKARPAIASVFGPAVAAGGRDRAPSPLPPRPSSTTSNKASSSRHQGSPNQPHISATTKVLRRPKRARTYGDGTELDGIEDLPTDREKEGRFRVVPKGVGGPRLSKGASEKDLKGTVGRKAGRREGSEVKPQQPAPVVNTLRRKDRIDFNSKHIESQPRSKRKKSSPQTPSNVPGGTTRRKPTLIRNLGGAGAPKVVGDMKWNPQTLRWEGNDQALRDFDAATSSSTRPALITHLTGSSIGSPVATFASGARVVGNMMFDPTRMCWISRLPPEEDEPDVFADLADDEEEWECRGGTIRAGQPLDQSLATAATRGDTPSPKRPTSTHSRAMSESGSERGARPALSSLLDVDGKLLEKCRIAEDRHRAEMKGWRLRADNDEPDRASLYEIRALATRQY